MISCVSRWLLPQKCYFLAAWHLCLLRSEDKLSASSKILSGRLLSIHINCLNYAWMAPNNNVYHLILQRQRFALLGNKLCFIKLYFLWLSGRGSIYCYFSYQEVTDCHYLNWNDLLQRSSRILSNNEVEPPLIALTPHNRLLRVPAWLAIITHQSLKAFDWNKLLRVISQVQITLIQAHVAKAGHDWVISLPVTLFITVINVSASALWEGRNWWMVKHSVCVFQFLTSLLISSRQTVQYLTLIYFYGGGSPPVFLRRRWRERNNLRVS